jgi:hypothetical protein
MLVTRVGIALAMVGVGSAVVGVGVAMRGLTVVEAVALKGGARTSAC